MAVGEDPFLVDLFAFLSVAGEDRRVHGAGALDAVYEGETVRVGVFLGEEELAELRQRFRGQDVLEGSVGVGALGA